MIRWLIVAVMAAGFFGSLWYGGGGTTKDLIYTVAAWLAVGSVLAAVVVPLGFLLGWW